MKKIGTTIGILMMVTVLAVPAFAYRGGWGHGPCSAWEGRHADLTDEQRTELRKLKEKFLDETSSLRRDVWAKSDELDAILSGSSPDVKKAKALQKEVSKLRTEMAAKRTDFILEAKKISPDADFRRGPRKGHGPCLKGYHGSRAEKCSGPCWNK